MLRGVGDFVSKFLVNLVLQQFVHDLSIHSDSLGIQLHIKYCKHFEYGHECVIIKNH